MLKINLNKNVTSDKKNMCLLKMNFMNYWKKVKAISTEGLTKNLIN